MFKSLLKKIGFTHNSDIPKIIADFNKDKELKELQSKLEFNNRVFSGMPIISINNYEDVVEIGIIQNFEMFKTLNCEKIIPIVKVYYSNRTDNFYKNKKDTSFSQYVTFSQQRLKAYLKMNGRERTSMLIECYKYSTIDLDSAASIAKNQPSFDEVMVELKKTSFFEDSKGYCI